MSVGFRRKNKQNVGQKILIYTSPKSAKLKCKSKNHKYQSHVKKIEILYVQMLKMKSTQSYLPARLHIMKEVPVLEEKCNI